MFNGLKIYGKSFNELNQDERTLLMVDCSLCLLFNNVKPEELDDEIEESLIQLNLMRADLSIKCAGYSESDKVIYSTEQLLIMVENTRYSLGNFINTHIKFANLMAKLEGNLQLCEN